MRRLLTLTSRCRSTTRPRPARCPCSRFGRSYRFRARVVDLAGNSLPFSESAPFDYTTDPVGYGRLEPVGSPTIVPCAPRTPGESLETLVIRSNYDVADSTVAPCQRHLAPPGTRWRWRRRRGARRRAAGVPDKARYAMLAARDGLSYKTPSVLRSVRRQERRPSRSTSGSTTRPTARSGCRTCPTCSAAARHSRAAGRGNRPGERARSAPAGRTGVRCGSWSAQAAARRSRRPRDRRTARSPCTRRRRR